MVLYGHETRLHVRLEVYIMFHNYLNLYAQVLHISLFLSLLLVYAGSRRSCSMSILSSLSGLQVYMKRGVASYVYTIPADDV